MQSSNRNLKLLFSLILVTNIFGWDQDVAKSDELCEVLFSGSENEFTLNVKVQDNGLVDVAIFSARGEMIYFSSENTSNLCNVSVEPFMIEENTGTMVLLNVSGGGNYQPYESYCVFIDSTDFFVYKSLPPSDWHNMGEPGPYYSGMMDTDSDGYLDHLIYSKYVFYIPEECQALQRQLWMDYLKKPYCDSSNILDFEDNTLAVLVSPESQLLRDIWTESMSIWLEESADISQSHQSILEVRSQIYALKAALLSNNYELVSELYNEL